MASQDDSGKQVLLIASPLEDEHVARIRAFSPGRIEVVHEPDLLAIPRYVADHVGRPRDLTDEQRDVWAAHLSRASILFDFDRLDPASLPARAPRLRWVQATSSGVGEFLRRHGLDRSDIAFTTAAGVHARPLAEFALLGLLHFFRDVPRLDAMKKARRWERYTVDGLGGKRVLVVGLGAVGRETARQCASFGVEVWGSRRSAEGGRPEGVARIHRAGTAARGPARDRRPVLACPMTEETRAWTSSTPRAPRRASTPAG